MKKIVSLMVATIMTAALLVGCGGGGGSASGSSGGEKTFTYGTTAYGTGSLNDGLDPHNGYMGWSAIRYGVGQTLYRFTESMELEPWLAASAPEQVDDYTVRITLKDAITFSNGKKVTAEDVKANFESLMQKHDRAPGDLKIKEMKAEGQTITITSEEKAPALVNYLSDPYGCIIDMDAGLTAENIAIGTGPYKAETLTPTEINLVKNENYWGSEKPKVDKVTVKGLVDGDTLTMALQNGELDATQGLPYGSKSLFENNNAYKISSAETSRVYMAEMNFDSEMMKDEKVREAIAYAIDKKSFTSVLLKGNGTPAVGAFPDNFTFGGSKLKAPEFNIDKAKELLKEAGYEDTDGDGIVEKNGKALAIRWLTYPNRQELPLLAESVQATLKEIGIDVQINSTENHKQVAKSGEYDVYASAIVAAPTGDPQYFITSVILPGSSYNRTNYQSDKVDALAEKLRNEYDTSKRSELAIQIQQQVLDDSAIVFASHLKMSLVMKKEIEGFTAHPSDYYEITEKLDVK